MKVRLRSLEFDFYVDVVVRNFGDAWLSVADIAGDKELGLAGSARAAVSASLAALGPRAATSLLADLQLPANINFE